MCTLLDVHILKNHRPLLRISLQRKWMTDDSLITIIVYRFNIHQLSSLVSRWTMFSYDLTCTSLSTCVCIVLCSVNSVSARCYPVTWLDTVKTRQVHILLHGRKETLHEDISMLCSEVLWFHQYSLNVNFRGFCYKNLHFKANNLLLILLYKFYTMEYAQL